MPFNFDPMDVTVTKGGAFGGTRQTVNLIEGSNVTITATDNAAANQIDVTINSTGGGSTYSEVNTYADLPSAAANSGTIYVVKSTTGTLWFTRKEAGLWRSDGATWTRLGSWNQVAQDSIFEIVNASDTTKVMQMDASGITTGTTRTLTVPDKSGTIALTGDVYSTVTKTANYTATTADVIILADATAGNMTITLYTAVGNQGRRITVKKIDSSANTVTIDATSTETIDGSLTAVISVQYVSLSLTSDNANWFIY